VPSGQRRRGRFGLPQRRDPGAPPQPRVCDCRELATPLALEEPALGVGAELLQMLAQDGDEFGRAWDTTRFTHCPMLQLTLLALGPVVRPGGTGVRCCRSQHDPIPTAGGEFEILLPQVHRLFRPQPGEVQAGEERVEPFPAPRCDLR
jgi:hypothetical protein